MEIEFFIVQCLEVTIMQTLQMVSIIFLKTAKNN